MDFTNQIFDTMSLYFLKAFEFACSPISNNFILTVELGLETDGAIPSIFLFFHSTSFSTLLKILYPVYPPINPSITMIGISKNITGINQLLISLSKG